MHKPSTNESAWLAVYIHACENNQYFAVIYKQSTNELDLLGN